MKNEGCIFHRQHASAVSAEVERRLMFDVSTIAEWVDTPVGIVRIERALAARARFHVRQGRPVGHARASVPTKLVQPVF
jgi:hypothetical protein